MLSVDRPSTECRPITDRYIGQVSTNYRPTIGEVSAKCRWTKSYIGRDTSGTTIGRVSTECRPTIDRLSTECWPTIDRVSTAISTDISVDIWPTANKIRFLCHLYFNINACWLVVLKYNKFIRRVLSSPLFSPDFFNNLRFSFVVKIARQTLVLIESFQKTPEDCKTWFLVRLSFFKKGSIVRVGHMGAKEFMPFTLARIHLLSVAYKVNASRSSPEAFKWLVHYIIGNL